MRTKRHLLALLALAGLGLTAHAQTAATDWPNKRARWAKKPERPWASLS